MSTAEQLDLTADVKEITAHFLSLLEKKYSGTEMDIIVDYLREVGGKRLRPLICSYVYQMVSGSASFGPSLEPACAVEIIHNASLLVDDVFDKDILRRNKKSFYLKHSTFEALACAYSLKTTAYEIGVDTKNFRVMKTVSDASQNLASALFLEQTLRSKQRITKDHFFDILDRKTTSLFQAAAMGATIFAGGTEEQIERMKLFGDSFGRAYQLRDDVLAVISDEKQLGKTTDSDILNRIQSLIVIEAFDHCSGKDLELLERFYLKQEDVDVATIKETLTNSGAVTVVKNEVAKHRQLAIDTLGEFEDSEAKDKLLHLVKLIRF